MFEVTRSPERIEETVDAAVEALATRLGKRGRAWLRRWCEEAEVRVAVARHVRSGARLWAPPHRATATGGVIDQTHGPGDNTSTQGAEAPERPQFPLNCGFERGFEIGGAWARKMGWWASAGVPSERLMLVRWWLERLYQQPGHAVLRGDGRWWSVDVIAPWPSIPGEEEVPEWIALLPGNRPARDRMPCGLAALQYACDLDFVADIECYPVTDAFDSGTAVAGLCRQVWCVRDLRPLRTPPGPSGGERVPLRRAA